VPDLLEDPALHGVQRPRHLFAGRLSSLAQPSDGDRSFHDAVREYQKELLLRALTKHDWNVSEAARSLDLARSTMNRLIRQHGLRREHD
jgi:transcriptional regulator of acetoin/glycerol metabolism